MAPWMSPLASSSSMAARRATSGLVCPRIVVAIVNAVATATAASLMCDRIISALLRSGRSRTRRSRECGRSTSLREEPRVSDMSILVREAITKSAHAEDESRLARHWLDLLAQIEHLCVDRAVGDCGPLAPGRVD